jgi:phage terminase large subunit-like protein
VFNDFDLDAAIKASAALRFKRANLETRKTFLQTFDEETLEYLRFCWDLQARPEQFPPPVDWTYWLILAGRGFGKTRTGAEWMRLEVRANEFVNLVGATADDARDIMIEGESGILRICPPSERPEYKKSDRKLVWPNGATSLVFTADEPDRLRGKQHERVWADEIAAWRYSDSWDQLQFGLRLGKDPRACVTTTPRPIKIIKDLVKDPSCVVTRGTTYDNRANLAPAFFNKIIAKYEGTRLGRQELNAEILNDVVGALWSSGLIERDRVKQAPDSLVRVVVGVDPKVSTPTQSADDRRSLKQYGVTMSESESECGIVVVAKDAQYPPHFYILADYSLDAAPTAWAAAAVKASHAHRADRVIGEVNNGGDLVEAVIRTVDENVSYKAVRASRGKIVRAEPVAALSEQGRLHFVGTLPKLEDQCCSYVPGEKSPDRMDAMVWAVTELMDEGEHGGLMEYYRREAERINAARSAV